MFNLLKDPDLNLVIKMKHSKFVGKLHLPINTLENATILRKFKIRNYHLIFQAKDMELNNDQKTCEPSN